MKEHEVEAMIGPDDADLYAHVQEADEDNDDKLGLRRQKSCRLSEISTKRAMMSEAIVHTLGSALKARWRSTTRHGHFAMHV